jgi:hypothetical protein
MSAATGFTESVAAPLGARHQILSARRRHESCGLASHID